MHEWIDGGKKQSRAMVVDNIRGGRSFDDSAEIYNYNQRRMHPNTPEYPKGNPYDTGTDAEIRARGQTSIAKRNRSSLRKLVDGFDDISPPGFLKSIGIAMGLYSAYERSAKAAEILSSSDAIKRAREATSHGKFHDLQRALIGVGHPLRSVYEELLDENPALALAYREAVRLGMENYQSGLGYESEDAGH